MAADRNSGFIPGCWYTEEDVLKDMKKLSEPPPENARDVEMPATLVEYYAQRQQKAEDSNQSNEKNEEANSCKRDQEEDENPEVVKKTGEEFVSRCQVAEETERNEEEAERIKKLQEFIMKRKEQKVPLRTPAALRILPPE